MRQWHRIFGNLLLVINLFPRCIRFGGELIWATWGCGVRLELGPYSFSCDWYWNAKELVNEWGRAEDGI